MTGAAVDITREDRPSKGRYVARVDGHEAELTYSRANPRLLILDHTGVPDALRGRGLGEALVRRVVEDARRDGVKLIVLCPFAKSMMARRPEWRDVVAG